ncbi:MAG TPA: hypothetical protein VMH00_06340 [Candidatus Limnocylindrales bacterium]|nr:hypothetical protein [Candidatus Limnocylindrales bacterium]
MAQSTEFRSARNDYLWIAVGSALVALVGFARTFYLKVFFGTPSLSGLVQLHGVVMTAWLVVFVTQTWLVASHRVALHRRLGTFAVGLAAVIVILGEALTILAVRREGRVHRIGPFHYLLGINTVNLLLFAVFVGLGYGARRKPELHKRLMVLAALTLLAPAVARVALLFTHAPLAQFLAFYILFVICVVVDTIRHRRLHPALALGSLLTIVAFQASGWIVQTHAWMNMVTGIFG